MDSKPQILRSVRALFDEIEISLDEGQELTIWWQNRDNHRIRPLVSVSQKLVNWKEPQMSELLEGSRIRLRDPCSADESRKSTTALESHYEHKSIECQGGGNPEYSVMF